MFVCGALNVFKIAIERITRRENETMTEKSAALELHLAIGVTQLSVRACTVPMMLDGNNFVKIKTYR